MNDLKTQRQLQYFISALLATAITVVAALAVASLAARPI
jgi:hypothetical protein